MNPNLNRGEVARERDRRGDALHLPQLKAEITRLVESADRAVVRARLFQLRAPRLKPAVRLGALAFVKALLVEQNRISRTLDTELTRWHRDGWVKFEESAEAALKRAEAKAGRA